MSGRFPPSASGAGALAVIGVLVVASAIGVAPRFRSHTVGVADGGTGPAAVAGGPASAGSLDPGSQGGPATGPAASDPNAPAAQSGNGSNGTTSTATDTSGFQCAAGKNGGATDTGVSATEIKLASTVAESGLGSSFLGDAHFGMTSVANAVNRAGGICGRRLSLRLVDDGWKSGPGATYIRSFIQEGYFALAVVPSSEGLNAASANGDIDNAKIPVVGSDGMLASQYEDPWIWPVATSTISTVHIAARQMYAAGVRTFGIVYDKDYKFGTEGFAAFKAAVSRLKGATLKAEVGIPSGQQTYGGDVQKFEDGCRPCDGTFMLLEPDTAISWIQSDSSSGHYVFGSKRTDGPQPLFTSDFGQTCGALCNNMWVWTGYQAPYPPFADAAPDRAYINAIRSVSSSADTSNQFLEGSYVGMKLLVAALEKVGPNLTRERLRDTLNSMTFDSGLTKPERWSATNHYANTSMLGFTIQYSGGFNGFQYQNTGWVTDPWAQLDHP